MPQTTRFAVQLTTALLAWSSLFTGARQAVAQLPLEPRVTLGTVDGPAAVVLADLDRDGDLDALAASGPDGTGGEVAWWAFDESTGWGAKSVIETSFRFAKDVVAVDLDRDGDLDVAAVSFQDDELAWWENTVGDASAWSAKKTLSTTLDGAIALTAADLDRDGDPDLLVAASNDGAIRWFENDGSPGNGGWTGHDVSISISEPAAVAVGDLDFDGDLDVAGASSSNGELTWWQNDGTGGTWTPQLATADLSGPRELHVTDLDRDGDLDLVAADLDDGELVLVRNASGDGGTWSAPESLASLDGVRHLVVADLDFDGDLDLATADQVNGIVTFLENAAGDASAWTRHDLPGVLAGARGVAVGDVDGDGDPDLAATGFTADSISWWRNDPVHHRADFAEVVVSGDFSEGATAADLDRDGDLDIVAGRVGFSTWITFFERDGDTFTPQDLGDFAGLTGGGAVSVDVGDLDRDGDLDIAVGNFERVLWWQNDGSTSWPRHEVSSGHAGIEKVRIVDMNRDGIPDLFAQARTSEEVLWWQNDGTPADEMGGDGNSWTERLIDGDTEFPREAYVRDVDRDGDPDVVVFSQFQIPAGERVSYWRNDDGLGTSWSRQNIGQDACLAGGIGDLDGDGDLDLLVGQGTLRYLEHSGSGDGTSWEPSVQVGALGASEPFFHRIVSADFDLDGDVDAGVVGDTDNTYWFEHPGNAGGWTRHDITLGQIDTASLRAMEATGDGKPDLLAPSTNPGSLVLWQNQAAQAELLASEVASAGLANDEVIAALRLNARSLGRAEDSMVEIARLEVLLESAPGVPLTEVEANALFAGISLYEDVSASGTFEPEADDLIQTFTGLEPDDGLLQLELDDFLATIGTASYRSYFLVVETTADAASHGVEAVHLTLHTGRSRMEDVTYDAPLSLLAPEDVSITLAFEFPIFLDGFEIGDTSNWSGTID